MRGISDSTNLGLLNERSVISGVIQPGSTELTRMRWRANSTASGHTIEVTSPLEARQGLLRAAPCRVGVLAVTTSEPLWPWAVMWRTAARSIRKPPSTSTRWARPNSSIVISSHGVPGSPADDRPVLAVVPLQRQRQVQAGADANLKHSELGQRDDLEALLGGRTGAHIKSMRWGGRLRSNQVLDTAGALVRQGL